MFRCLLLQLLQYNTEIIIILLARTHTRTFYTEEEAEEEEEEGEEETDEGESLGGSRRSIDLAEGM